MNNIHGARINRDVLTPKGSGFVGGHAPDFLLANDTWSQIISLKTGPDGAVYMIDWYDKNQCHRTEDNAHDRTNGRIFKVSYGETAIARLPGPGELECVNSYADPTCAAMGGEVDTRVLEVSRASGISLMFDARNILAKLASRSGEPSRHCSPQEQALRLTESAASGSECVMEPSRRRRVGRDGGRQGTADQKNTYDSRLDDPTRDGG